MPCSVSEMQCKELSWKYIWHTKNEHTLQWQEYWEETEKKNRHWNETVYIIAVPHYFLSKNVVR